MAAIGWLYLGWCGLTDRLGAPDVPVCLFLWMTGERCPLCGLSHAFGRVLAGDLHGAEGFNALAAPAFVAWLVMTVAATAMGMRELSTNSR